MIQLRKISSRTCASFVAGAMFLSLAAKAEARDQIQIVGSSTVYPFSTIVAERHGQGGKFKTPVVESTGTGGGFKLFCGGVGEKFADIANASRPIKDSEREQCVKNGVVDIVEILIGNDGIAFSNSTKGKKQNLTKKQLWAAMSAKGPLPKKWSDIDSSLPNTKIEILTPPPTSGTRDAWNSLVMEKGCDPEVKAKNEKDCELMREDGAVVDAGENDALIVQKLNSNPDAFGIFGFSFLDSNRDKIQAASIDGVDISLEKIQARQYPVSRPLFIYVKGAHIGVIPGITEFVSEFTSQAAIGSEGYLADAGLVPLEEGEFKVVSEAVKRLETIQATGRASMKR